MTIDRADAFQMGRVISRSFGVLTRNVGMFLALTAILNVPNLLLTFYYARINPMMAAGGQTPANPAAAMAQLGQTLSTTLITGLVGAICTVVLQAALVQGAITDLNGDKPSLGNCLSTGLKSFLPLLAISVLAYLAILAGMVLLVVPGIILALMWVVVVPVCVVERPGIFASFGRSRAMTKGDRWKILGLLLLYCLCALAVGLVIALLFGVSLLRPGPANGGIAYLLANWLLNIPLTALLAVGVAAVYYELRLVKEGVGPQQLAAAFD